MTKNTINKKGRDFKIQVGTLNRNTTMEEAGYSMRVGDLPLGPRLMRYGSAIARTGPLLPQDQRTKTQKAMDAPRPLWVG